MIEVKSTGAQTAASKSGWLGVAGAVFLMRCRAIVLCNAIALCCASMLSSANAYAEQDLRLKAGHAAPSAAEFRYVLPADAAKRMEQINSMGREAAQTVDDLFGTICAGVQLRLVSELELQSYCPNLSGPSGIFFNNEILLPDRAWVNGHDQELRRTLMHEYTHAAVAQLSNYSAPAWLDEGLAQLVEDYEDPRLAPALRRWLSEHKPISLHQLTRDIISWPPSLQPVVYAHSLFAVRLLVQQHGLDLVKRYLQLLQRTPATQAFELVLGVPHNEFDQRLQQELQTWAAETQLQGALALRVVSR